jgi:sugar/nucleoside kinase (ribokinase family)
MGIDYKDKLLAKRISVFGGGATANCLVQAARLGGKAAWLGKLGNDWIGRKIIEQLEQEGVDCSGVVQTPDQCSPFNVAVYAGEQERRIGGFLLPNSLSAISDSDMESFCRHPREGDWMLVEVGEIPFEDILKFCRLSKAVGVKLMIDIDLDPLRQCNGSTKLIDTLFDLADILVPNRAAVESIYSDMPSGALAEEMAKTHGVMTIVTAGEDGVYFCTPESSSIHQKPYSVDVVDTVGAGDAFHGGVLYALAEGWPIERAVDLGARCGAENCKAFGARTGMPTQSDLGIG